MSGHLKRFYVPRTWKVKKKGIKYITKPSPGSHNRNVLLPLNVILRDMLNYANTNREVKFIIEKKNVLIDNIRRWDHKFPVGLFDILSLKETEEHFRIVLDNKGKVVVIKIGKEESMIKPCKIIGKTMIKGKTQLNLYDGKNIVVEKNGYGVGDTVLVVLDKKNLQIKQHIKLDKSALIYLTGGKHIGQVGKVEDIIGSRIIYKTEKGDVVETLKKYAFPIGKDKPLITLTRK